MTFEVPETMAMDVEVLKSQLNDLFKALISKSSVRKQEGKSSLRNAFSGDWGNGQDSVSYAQMLREESVQNNIEDISW